MGDVPYDVVSIELPDEAATEALGKCLAGAVKKLAGGIRDEGLNFRLEGTLGAGKTTLTRAFLRNLGVTGRVRSPTFTLVETYSALGLTINHFDFYRFESPEEFDDAGFRDLFGAGRVTLCEWPEKAGEFLPASDVDVQIELSGDGRKIFLRPRTERGRKVAEEVGREWK
ncbi:MAG: tRNA (adenosine(37)-N6)-threonylcarbamoyltransferase complex ATPase subunit type 1 TsaE [Sutterellaceae bacterium]|nr:tRNA (adenosine(37)-N6)-threonylcarbamoyltransferase complex ATPase subunit type 1 TsaE [Sutterellaceae bacterium]MDD7441846.1 tRNA (adenosine(37)-N6)-threonylcarbamoyltransferase complex ATPase subunit type 1 TsaE [Sutterellaceae bacterium]MDY2867696.1 tRNA (adenosine(37)-N6)-threonylcarbamoyltransferase complex ATPase subunit type 1 TsaE [Mesosutterella sp.]